MAEGAARLVRLCIDKGLRVAVAESCTGGLICAAITDIPGASAMFDCGFVTYSYESKTELLGVDAALLAHRGAVSEEVTTAMAQGALLGTEADLTVAVSGIAGPGGGTAEKPVGLVFITTAARFGKPRTEEHVFPGSRENIRLSTVEKALEMLHECACEY